MLKCKECEFASVCKYPRHGNGNSWRSGLFYQEGTFCNHPKCKNPLIFYGKNSPRNCPLKKGKDKFEKVMYIEADSLEECKEAIDDEDFALCDERIIDIKQISEAEYTHILYQGFMD